MGVMSGVAGTVDHDDPTVHEPVVEGAGRLPELRPALAAEHMEDGLAYPA